MQLSQERPILKARFNQKSPLDIVKWLIPHRSLRSQSNLRTTFIYQGNHIFQFHYLYIYAHHKYLSPKQAIHLPSRQR